MSKSAIFVSYRHDDSSGHAGRLYDRLAEHFGKDKLFRDIDHISYGEDFVEALDGAVGSCQALIAVIGPDWLTAKDKRGRRRLDNSDDFVRIEIESAISRDVPIFPVLVKNAEMPDSVELPERISVLARRQALEISETRVDYDVGELIKILEKTIGLASKPGPAPEPYPTLGLSKELEKELLPPSVKHKLSTLSESVQLRFLDRYRQKTRSIRIAYLFLFLPLPIFGLHNSYLGNAGRQIVFWVVCCLPVVLIIFYNADSSIGEPVLFAVNVWPLIDLFLLPSLVRKCNENAALKIVSDEFDESQK